MLLIRGLGSEDHAKLINEGLIGCRDVASTLTKSTNGTGYANSDYFESMFMKNRMGLSLPVKNVESLPSAWARVLKVMLDHYISQTYLTYFHIVESEATIDWLDSHWPDGGYFIYYVPHFENAESVYGKNYCGQRVIYVDSPEDINVRKTLIENPSLALLLGKELAGSENINCSMRYLEEVIDSSVPLFNRIRNGRFDDRENEYRIMARSHRSLYDGIVRTEVLSPYRINFKEDLYEVSINVSPDENTHTVAFDVSLVNDKGEVISYFDIAKEGGAPELVSNFINIDIRDTAERYGYIGNLEACKLFVRSELSAANACCREDENNHVFHGDWEKVARTRVRTYKNNDSKGMVLHVPETKHYSRFGPGFRETFLPNPIEMGYSSPSAVFKDVLEFITSRFEVQEILPIGLVHELLHACLAPWLPLKLYRPISLKESLSELEGIESGCIFFETPSKGNASQEYVVRLDKRAIRARLERNITRENMERTIALQCDNPTLRIDKETYMEFVSAVLDDFDSTKQQSIDSIIESLEQSCMELRSELHFARFFEKDSALRSLRDDAGLLFEYEIDAYNMQCHCSNHLCENNKIPIFLCPVQYDGWADLSGLSHALSKSIVADDSASSFVFLLNMATREGFRDAADKEWRLVCGECNNRYGEISAKLKPTRILIPESFIDSDANQILQALDRTAIKVTRLKSKGHVTTLVTK